ncbi:MAG: hypothetical protein KR126chlam3_00728 [Chlamydiae bacterium]|nr:hypothetical protein [Chlamydiota bacterium]
MTRITSLNKNAYEGLPHVTGGDARKESLFPKVDFKFISNLYSSILGTVLYGTWEHLKEKLEQLRVNWIERNAQIDVDQSIHKLARRIKMNPYIDSPVETKFYQPYRLSSDSESKDDSFEPLTVTSPSSFIKPTKRTSQHEQQTYPLKEMQESEIFERLIPVPVSEVKSEGVIISFSNAFRGGGAPNISLRFKMPLRKILTFNDVRISLEKFLISEFQHFSLGNFDFKDIEHLNLVELVEKTAEKIKNIHNNNIQVYAFERILYGVLKILLNSFPKDGYNLTFRDGQFPRGQHYFHHGTDAGLFTPFFAIHTKDSAPPAMPADLYIKQGAGDCRASNSIFAALLNVGYAVLGVDVEAKVIYAKERDCPAFEDIEERNTEDHCLAIVKDHEEYRVKDVYFEPINDLSLHELIEGRENKDMFVQIQEANPYPKEQNQLWTNQKL